MNARTDVRMETVQFFRWAELQDARYELADGRAVVLPYVTRNHWRIGSNVLIAVGTKLDRARFDVGAGDFAVETGERSIRYADVMVTPFHATAAARTTRDALLLVEIASPSTVHIDFGEKLREYKALPMLGTYVICAQDEARVWVWTRSDGQWPDGPDILEGLNATVVIPNLEITLPLSEIYANAALR